MFHVEQLRTDRIMKKSALNEYQKYREAAETISFGGVYPRTVVNGMQSGEIYTEEKAALIWHHCGFAWHCGEYGKSFLDGIERLRTEGSRRLVLFTEDGKVREYFEACGASVGRRLFFKYGGGKTEAVLPEGFEPKLIGAELFESLEGRVVPKLFWRDAEEYLRSGTGFCLMCGSDPAAWAFTASSDGRESDIGVETAEKFRGRGLAFAAAALTVNAVISAGAEPVWACDSGNTASQGLARKLGFECISECWRIR